jgi:hypothetical protein
MRIVHIIDESGYIAAKGMKWTSQLFGPSRLFRWCCQKNIMALELQGQGKGQHRLNITP